MSTSTIYRGGLPTEPDVKRLREAFPVIEPGELIAYADIETVIGQRKGTSRFTTVVNAWRASLRKHDNFRLRAIRGHGFSRLAEYERSQDNVRGWVRDQRRARRKLGDQTMVNTTRFDGRQLQVHLHVTRVMTVATEHTHRATKEIAPPAPVRTLPAARARKDDKE